jgi:hypothetical protein
LRQHRALDERLPRRSRRHARNMVRVPVYRRRANGWAEPTLRAFVPLPRSTTLRLSGGRSP